jgi:5'-nucleotidase
LNLTKTPKLPKMQNHPKSVEGTVVSAQKSGLILVTNDDGVASPGLLAAVRSVLDLGEVWVVAPLVQQSGLGRSFPGGRIKVETSTLEVDGQQVPSFALDTSPAQAVRHGILRFLPRKPALAISGINYGENLGGCITISGTVGAAIEAASLGIPTLAASLETDRQYHFSHSQEVDFGAAGLFVRRFAKWLLAHGMPDGVDILKLDVPSDATADTPWRTTRVSRQQYFITPITVDEQGRKHASGYARHIDFETLEPESDIHAVAVDRAVSVSPLTMDLTAGVDLQRLRHSLCSEDPVT